MVGRCGGEYQPLGVAGVAGDADLQGCSSRGPTPGGKCGLPQLCGQHAVHRALGTRHDLLDDSGDRPGAFERPRDRLDRLANVRQCPTEPLQSLTLLGRELNEQYLRVDGPVARRATRCSNGRAAPYQAFQCGVRVGSRKPGRARRGIPGRGPQAQ